MEKENIFKLTEIIMMANGFEEVNKDQELSIIQTVINIPGNGKIIKEMDQVFLFLLMGICKLENIKMNSQLETIFIYFKVVK